MKTKLTLTILACIYLLGSAASFLIALVPHDPEIPIFLSENADVLRMGNLMFYVSGALFLIIGLILLMSRKCSLATAKNILLACIIGELVHIYVQVGIVHKEPLFYDDSGVIDSVLAFIPIGLAIFGYFKAKE